MLSILFLVAGSMSFIDCRNLVLGYDGNVVSRDINFSVEEGDYLCILGENGAGKSTLMKTLLHLIEPVSGQIVYGSGLRPYEIGYLPQQTPVQRDFPASVLEVVLSGCLSKLKLRFFYSAAEKKAARENMERLDIWDLRKKSYRNLSGGQQQRVLLARALCATSKLLILDEPVSGLDPKVTLNFYELIKKLNSEGITIIMVSHDFDAALSYADKILHIGNKQLYFGGVSEYKESDAYRMFSNFGGV